MRPEDLLQGDADKTSDEVVQALRSFLAQLDQHVKISGRPRYGRSADWDTAYYHRMDARVANTVLTGSGKWTNCWTVCKS